MSWALAAQRPRREKGIALLVMLTFVILWCLSLVVGQLSARQLQAQGGQRTAAALLQAKQELLADAVFRSAVANAARLRLPDIGESNLTYHEGDAGASFAGNARDVSVVGKFPWRTLDAGPLRDSAGECLWYAVSGRYKTTPVTTVLNWDTPGQIDIADSNGNLADANLAGVLIAPGAALDGQDRHLADPAYLQCGGNYQAQNYLDPYAASDAPTREANWFSGTNSRLTPGTANKRLLLADSAHYNDRFVGISGEEIFDLVIKRKDFSDAVSALLANADLAGAVITGPKGTDAFACPSGDDFCANWREMLFLTSLTLPSDVSIDGSRFAGCSRVVIFSGRKGPSQNRRTAAEKADKRNYLEEPNASSFSVPVASSPAFSGTATFNWRTPGADVIRCLP